jgi:hypothetical protein
MRLALLQEGDAQGRTAAATLALQAARDGGSIPTLWLVAGISGYRTGQPWAGEALSQACALDPLGGFVPFYLTFSDLQTAAAPVHGAHALLADPRLAAAVLWEGHRDLFQRSLLELGSWPGVDPAWREALAMVSATQGQGAARGGETAWLGLGIDTTPSLALSLHTFRRRAWPAWWQAVEVRRRLAESLESLPPALQEPAAAAWARRSCRQ